MTLSCIGRCIKINSKSQSPAFKRLSIGDLIIFSTEIKAVGRNRGTYATYINCYNPISKENSQLSFNQIGRVLNNFEFEQEEK